MPNFDVVGLDYRMSEQAQLTLKVLVESEPLKCKLTRQPKNPKDKNAIKVICDDPRLEKTYKLTGPPPLHVGYLRKEVAAVIAPSLDNESIEITFCRLVGVDAEDGRASVLVKLKTPASKPKISS